MRLGQIKEKQGDLLEAKRNFEMALKLDSKSKGAREGLERVSKQGVALMAGGYWMGEWYDEDDGKRKKLLRVTGMALIQLFIGLRLTNIYGD